MRVLKGVDRNNAVESLPSQEIAVLFIISLIFYALMSQLFLVDRLCGSEVLDDTLKF